MGATGEAITGRRSGAFEPASLRDHYHDALRELVEAKTKGPATTPRAIAESPKVINLMEALKRSLAQDTEPAPRKQPRANPSQRRLFPTVKGRCCFPYPAVATKRTRLLRSRRHRPGQSGGRRRDKAGGDLYL
jgi:hypothetical protein